MSDIESKNLTDQNPTAGEVIFASVLLGIAGFAFYSAAVIVFGAI